MCNNNIVDFDVRLPLNSFYGPLEMRRFGLWGHVCSSNWDDLDANFFCRKLGFNSGRAVITYADDNTPIIMGYVNCTGTEDSSLKYCPATDFGEDHGCYRRHFTGVAGVVCSDNQGDISLQNVIFVLRNIFKNNLFSSSLLKFGCSLVFILTPCTTLN